MKGKGTVLDRFKMTVRCMACPHDSKFFSDFEIYAEAEDGGMNLRVAHKDVSYVRWFTKKVLSEAEKAEGLEVFADKEIRIGIVGIRLIEEKNPFEGREEMLKMGGEYRVFYGGD